MHGESAQGDWVSHQAAEAPDGAGRKVRVPIGEAEPAVVGASGEDVGGPDEVVGERSADVGASGEDVSPTRPAESLDEGALDMAEAALDAVAAALDRLADGTYGTCGICGRTIDDDVLAADPTADRCPAHLPLSPGAVAGGGGSAGQG